jgi:general secretion pathway protein I
MSNKAAGFDAAGFTLLEVVVALVIAGLAAVVLFRAGGDGLFAVDTAARADEAVERAQSHLAAIGNDIAALPAEEDGDDGGGYRWRMRIRPIGHRQSQASGAGISAGPQATTTLYDVEVAISWPGHDHDRAVVLRTERIATVAAGQ